MRTRRQDADDLKMWAQYVLRPDWDGKKGRQRLAEVLREIAERLAQDDDALDHLISRSDQHRVEC